LVRENLQETIGFYHQIYGFPATFPPNQSNECSFSSFSQKRRLHLPQLFLHAAESLCRLRAVRAALGRDFFLDEK
jgi:hypothetical protein